MEKEHNEKEKGKIRTLWTYFKKGKAELWFILSIYNSFILSQLKGNTVMHIIYVWLILGFIGGSIIIGWYVTKRIETQTPYISPYTQDFLKAELYLSNAIGYLICGQHEQALSEIQECRRLREKWIDV